MSRKGFFRDIGTTLISQILIGLTGILLIFILSRKIGIEGYGEIVLTKRAGELLWTVCLLGLTISIPRNKAFIDQERPGTVEASILFLLPLMNIFGLLVTAVVSFILLGDLYQQYVVPIMFLVSGYMVSGYLYAYYRSTRNFNIGNLQQITIYAIIPLFSIAPSGSAVQYMYNLSISIFAFSILCWLYLIVVKVIPVLKREKQPVLIYIKGFNYMLRYGFGRVIGLLLAGLTYTTPLALLNHFASPTDVGYFSQIIQLISIINMPIGAVGAVILPELSYMITSGKKIMAKQLIVKLYRISIRFGAIFGVIAIVFPNEILYMITGQHTSLNSYDIIILFCGMFLLIYNLFRNPIDAGSFKPYSTINIVIAFCTSIFIGFMLASTLPIIVSIKISVAVAYLLLGCISLLLLIRIYEIRLFKYRDIVYIFIYVGGLLTCTYIKSVDILAAIILSSLIVLFFIGSLLPEIKVFLKRKKGLNDG